jgi:hypothetical protein
MDGSGKCLPNLPPSQHPLWQSESGGGTFLTGTEGYIQYVLAATTIDSSGNTVQSPELITIHWDNPFVWDEGTEPIVTRPVSTSEVTGDNCPQPPLTDTIQIGFDTDPGPGFNGIGGPARHELFTASIINNGVGLDLGTGPGVGFEIAFFWPGILTSAFIQALQDIHLEFTIVLRKKGSVSSTICSFYDGKLGLKALASKAGQSSLKKLFNF